MTHKHTRCTLLLRVSNGYVGCLHRVSTDEFNTLVKTKAKYLTQMHIGLHVQYSLFSSGFKRF